MGFFKQIMKKRKEKKHMKKEQKDRESSILQLYNNWKEQPEYIDAKIGERYYKGKNDILKRKKFKTVNGTVYPLPDLANNKLNHNFAKALVDQKVNYCLGKDPKFTCADEKYLEIFEKWAEENSFSYWLNFLGLQTSNQGRAWLFCYIDETGEFRIQVFDFTECIPIWTDKLHTALKAIVRIYTTTGESLTVPNAVTHLEYWTATGKQTYSIDGDILLLENSLFTQVSEIQGNHDGFEPHYLNNDTACNWGRVPFICFKNNIIEQPDVIAVKNLIDNFDLTRSDLANTLEQLINFIITLTNAGGTDLEEFVHNLKEYGVAKLDDNAGMGGAQGIGILSQPIDCTASETHTTLLEKSIIELSQSVNLNTDLKLPPSGVSLKLLYQGLEIKCNGLEKQFTLAFNQFQYFFSKYVEETLGYKPSAKIKIKFQINSIINDNEKADTMSKQADAFKKMKGIVSDETLLKNHPWVTDPAEELKKISKAEDDYFGKGNVIHHGL